MSVYNILTMYSNGVVDKAAGIIGFNDTTPGIGKHFRLPPFNTITFQVWGAGGSGGGGDHNITPTGTDGQTSQVYNLPNGNYFRGLGGGAGQGGNNSGQQAGYGGAAGLTNYATGLVYQLLQGISGSSGQDAQGGSSGYNGTGGAGGNSPGSGGIAGGNSQNGGVGGVPGGGGGGGGYESTSGGGGGKGKKGGGGGSTDQGGGGGGGGGGYITVTFKKGQLPQNYTITYDVGLGGVPHTAEYLGGNGGNGKLQINWT